MTHDNRPDSNAKYEGPMFGQDSNQQQRIQSEFFDKCSGFVPSPLEARVAWLELKLTEAAGKLKTLDNCEDRLSKAEDLVTMLAEANVRVTHMQGRIDTAMSVIADARRRTSDLETSLARMANLNTEFVEKTKAQHEKTHDRIDAIVKGIDRRCDALVSRVDRIEAMKPKPPFPPDLVALVRAARAARDLVGNSREIGGTRNVFHLLSAAIAPYRDIAD